MCSRAQHHQHVVSFFEADQNLIIITMIRVRAKIAFRTQQRAYTVSWPEATWPSQQATPVKQKILHKRSRLASLNNGASSSAPRPSDSDTARSVPDVAIPRAQDVVSAKSSDIVAYNKALHEWHYTSQMAHTCLVSQRHRALWERRNAIGVLLADRLRRSLRVEMYLLIAICLGFAVLFSVSSQSRVLSYRSLLDTLPVVNYDQHLERQRLLRLSGAIPVVDGNASRKK